MEPARSRQDTHTRRAAFYCGFCEAGEASTRTHTTHTTALAPTASTGEAETFAGRIGRLRPECGLLGLHPER